MAIGARRTRTVTVANSGTVALDAIQFDFSGQNGEHFVLGTTLPRLSVGSQVSVPVVFAPQVVAPEINHTTIVTHADVQGVPCSTFSVSLRGGSFEIPDTDAGVDAGTPDATAESGVDAGVDAGPFIPVQDAGHPFDGGGGFVAVASLQDPRSHFAAAALSGASVLVGGGYGISGEVLDSVEQVDTATGRSSVVARFAEGIGRAQLTATSLSDGRVLFIGGLLPGADDLALPTGELVIFTPSSQSLSPLGTQLGTPRFGHTAVAIDENRVLVAFGETRGAVGDPFVPVGDPQLVFLEAQPPVAVPEEDPGAAAPRAGTTATLLGDGRVVYVGGIGADGVVLDRVDIYEDGVMRETNAALHEPRHQHAAVLLADGRIVVVGGVGIDGAPCLSVEVVSTGGEVTAWESVRVWEDLGPRVRPMAAAVGPSAILVAGGASWPEVAGAAPRRALDDAVLLLAVDGQFLVTSPTNRLASPRWRGELIVQGEVGLVLGGSTTTRRRSPLGCLERFNLRQGRFEHFGLFGPGATASSLLDGRLLVAGGLDPHSDLPGARTRLYRAEDEVLLDGPDLAVERWHHSATLIAPGVVLVAGGMDASGGTLGACELLDLGFESATPAARLQIARSRHTATLLADGAVLICGGVGASGDVLESCERYDPGAQLSAPDDDSVSLVAGYMSAARVGHQATLLDDGRVLLSGGSDPARGVRRDDLFDPAGSGLRPVAGLPGIARRLHVAVLVGQGRVLLAGGEAYNGAYFATDHAELFDAGVDGYLDLPPMVTPRIGPAALRFQGGVVLLAGGIRPTSATPERPSQSLSTSEVFDPQAGVGGAFTSVDMPLRAPRGLALGTQIVDQPLVLFGESRDGLLEGGAEQRTVRVTLERWDPEVP